MEEESGAGFVSVVWFIYFEKRCRIKQRQSGKWKWDLGLMFCVDGRPALYTNFTSFGHRGNMTVRRFYAHDSRAGR